MFHDRPNEEEFQEIMATMEPLPSRIDDPGAMDTGRKISGVSILRGAVAATVLLVTVTLLLVISAVLLVLTETGVISW